VWPSLARGVERLDGHQRSAPARLGDPMGDTSSRVRSSPIVTGGTGRRRACATIPMMGEDDAATSLGHSCNSRGHRSGCRGQRRSICTGAWHTAPSRFILSLTSFSASFSGSRRARIGANGSRCIGNIMRSRIRRVTRTVHCVKGSGRCSSATSSTTFGKHVTGRPSPAGPKISKRILGTG
jgi:hypothetical protein